MSVIFRIFPSPTIHAPNPYKYDSRKCIILSFSVPWNSPTYSSSPCLRRKMSMHFFPLILPTPQTHISRLHSICIQVLSENTFRRFYEKKNKFCDWFSGLCCREVVTALFWTTFMGQLKFLARDTWKRTGYVGLQRNNIMNTSNTIVKKVNKIYDFWSAESSKMRKLKHLVHPQVDRQLNWLIYGKWKCREEYLNEDFLSVENSVNPWEH